MHARFALELLETGRPSRAYEPTPEEIAVAAPLLAAYYNEPHNREMLSHTAALTVSDVVAHYCALLAAGARPLLLEHDGVLVGDADVRHIDGHHAEVAILVGDRTSQGQGLGTRFGVILHTFAFRVLGLARVYASIIPSNRASLRLFEKLGYQRDDTPAARRHADEPDDLTLSTDAARFAVLHGERASRVNVMRRPSPEG